MWRVGAVLGGRADEHKSAPGASQTLAGWTSAAQRTIGQLPSLSGRKALSAGIVLIIL
jgi:hypothetical protein